MAQASFDCFAVVPLAGVRPGADREPVGDRVQPAAERLPPRHRLRLADQHEEGGLEGVVDVGRVGQHLTAGREDEPAVAAD
jgi:hypothetical protein